MTDEPTHYDILGIPITASPQEIRKAYRLRAKALHPDLKGDKAEYTRRFQRLNDAYATLKNPARRAAYDATLPRRTDAPFPHAAGFSRPQEKPGPTEDVFEGAFGDEITGTSWSNQLNNAREAAFVRRAQSYETFLAWIGSTSFRLLLIAVFLFVILQILYRDPLLVFQPQLLASGKQTTGEMTRISTCADQHLLPISMDTPRRSFYRVEKVCVKYTTESGVTYDLPTRVRRLDGVLLGSVPVSVRYLSTFPQIHLVEGLSGIDNGDVTELVIFALLLGFVTYAPRSWIALAVNFLYTLQSWRRY